MKKLLLILFVAFVSAWANAQNSNTNYSIPFVGSYIMAIHTTDTQFERLGFLHLECNNDMSRIWVKCRIITPYDVDELIDEKGRRAIGTYTITQNKNLYIKLGNDSIVALTCSYISKVHSGYYTSSTSVYKQYDMYCYFDLSESQIKQLLTNKIAKIRGEFKYEVMDLKFDNDQNFSFRESYLKLKGELIKKRVENDEQEKLKSNPLSDF